ncbi:hypothetical protein J4G33_08025 [Actinotalea sp. BY-33]|uniref:Polyhydroxybutyrate depolymerase n=1 Tax=Actinotalea soli TaxID=2819234 RepID=A0A939LP32_9CELL|nr:PHB depolymerase family esterase [Actinotalea soli]MBO1751746.1 hypothetical protein [Actinotalea soli]
MSMSPWQTTTPTAGTTASGPAPSPRRATGAALGVLALTALGACSASEEPTTSPEGDATETVACEAPAPGRSTLDLVVDGVERTAEVYVPEAHDGETLAPAVLALHGSNNTPEMLLQISLLEETAEAEGFVLVVPQGSVPGGDEGTWAWNVPGVTDAPAGTPDDGAFVAELVDTVAADLCVDTQQVYATGYSGGGRMISAVACEDPGLLAAIAPVVGLRAGVPVEAADSETGLEPDAATCDPASGTPVIAFTGTEDPINPAEGGGAPYWGYSAQQATDRWAEINGCEAEPTTETSGAITTATYTSCSEGNELVEHVMEGVGHVWPGGDQGLHAEYVSVLGTPTDEISANALMWEFFTADR